MVLADIEQGHGVAVLDPHGDLVERILYLIPERYVERTIYLNPGDPEWVPIWNPLNRIPGQDIGRTTDDIVRAIQSFVSSGGWGDRLENLLRNIIFSMMHLPNGTFLDISNLLRNKADSESNTSPRDPECAFPTRAYANSGFMTMKTLGRTTSAPRRINSVNSLSPGTVSLMLSQPESRFNFRRIMDEGMILLVNLSTLGSMEEILGSFILTFLHLAALSRSDLAITDRKQFHIHCDEAHKFMTDSMEDLIAETRKYAVSLSLAHQFLSSLVREK